MEKHLAEMKKDVEANEEKDREREKQRVRESKLQKKIKEKAQNVVEEAPMVLLGSEEEGEQSMEEEFSVGFEQTHRQPTSLQSDLVDAYESNQQRVRTRRKRLRKLLRLHSITDNQGVKILLLTRNNQSHLAATHLELGLTRSVLLDLDH
jgi:hypothetical protein